MYALHTFCSTFQQCPKLCRRLLSMSLPVICSILSFCMNVSRHSPVLVNGVWL
jgi:hypothetical protein